MRLSLGYLLFVSLLSTLWFGIAEQEALAQNRELTAHIQELINTSKAKDAFWSLSVRDLNSRVWVEINPHKHMVPASNLKLLSSAAVLDALGTDFTYRTKIYGRGSLEGSTWRGHLYLMGVGDPSISGLFYNGEALYVFRSFYEQLAALGIQAIEGNLIGNQAYFTAEALPMGWNWDDLSYYYAPEVSALSFNSNCVEVQVDYHGKLGETPRVEWFPFNTDYVAVVNQQRIGRQEGVLEEAPVIRRALGHNRIELSGVARPSHTSKELITVHQPTGFFLDSFQHYLEQQGLTVRGGLVTDYEVVDFSDEEFQLLASHQSVDLRRMLAQVNKESDNFFIEMLLRTAAAERYGEPGSLNRGLELVEQFALNHGFSENSLQLTDACGLGRTNFLTTDGLSAFLVAMRGHPDYYDFRQSLSVAGIDGTLQSKFARSPLRGKLHGKSGYLSGVYALSGYLETKAGEELAFSLITNNFTVTPSQVIVLQKKILQTLYENL